MKEFAQLFDNIDQTQSTNEKVLAMRNYFSTCSDADGAWALFFLCGHRIKRLISSRKLFEWCCHVTPLPDWLIEESYAAVGDTAETISLLLPYREQGVTHYHCLSDWMENLIKPLQDLHSDLQEERIRFFWEQLSTKEIFILNKILTGAFRMGVSSLLTIKALSQALDVSREILSQKLMGSWEPTPDFFASLKSQDQHQKYLNPYPFYLAYPFEGDLDTLGSPYDWVVEWKWDGIRAQVVIRDGACAIWSRGNELISNQFPELLEAFQGVEEMVLDGEIVAYHNERPLNFGELQKRLGRKQVSKAMMEKVPVAFIIYDLLEYHGNDLRTLPLSQRRSLFENFIFTSPKIRLSLEIGCPSWETITELHQQARDNATEGIMLKKRDSPYGVGRQKGYWWKYKVNPMTLDAVLIYAQPGSGRRANLFTDYTFAIWKDKELIPIAKAYSGLNQDEIQELDMWIRKNTEEKFGPVRKVKPYHVFEIAFEGIQKSNRHKSGVALRFPRIARWRKDKPYEECDSLETILETFFHEKP